MTNINRRPFSAEEKKILWERWRQGDSIAEIGRALFRVPPAVRHILLSHGGISPPARKRSPRTLQLNEREAISRGLSAGQSMRTIAQTLNRSPSTISREIHRNGGYDHYRALTADKAAWQRACRPKSCKLARNKALCQKVAHQLKQRWSPEQIAAWLKRSYPGQPEWQVSHETIYRSLYVQARGALKKELTQHLRRHHKLRRGQFAQGEQRGRIPEAVSIRQRPPSIEDRAVPGHWEGDLIMGSNNSCIATLVERQTRYVMLIKVDDKRTETVISALTKHIQKLPRELSRSLTWDRGAELKGHHQFSLATGVDVYFCDPGSPWQRGSNENTNGLLRQYFPKGSDLSVHLQRHLDAVARQLNERPRKTLGFETPAERFAACVAATR
jgi:IS30 family transposase